MKTPNPDYYRQDEAGHWWHVPNTGHGHRTRAHVKECESCGEEYVIDVYHVKRSRFCSRQCGCRHVGRLRAEGRNHPAWNGGRIIRHGYVTIYSPEHPSVQGKRGKYVAEQEEQVHHVNGIKDDNRPENLELWVGSHPTGVRAGQHCPTCTCGLHGPTTLKITVA